MTQPKPNLDLMRSAAISLVVFDHFLHARGVIALPFFRSTWEVTWIGIFGVYLFFVHTCLVLMWSLERKPHTLDFYIRRVFRIYPLAIVAILFLFVFHLPFADDLTHQYGYFHPTLTGLLSNLLLIQNIARGGGYAMSVMWSLCLEVQMYILLPVLYFFVRRNFALWPLLLLWALGCGLAFHYTNEGNSFITVVPCFLPGVMAYVLYTQVPPKMPAWLFPVFLAVLGIVFMLFHSPNAGWIACLTLALALPRFRELQFSPLRRLVYVIAKYSYSIYLTHKFAQGIVFYWMHVHSLFAQIALVAALTALFSAAGYHLIEAPMIRLGAALAARAERRYQQHSAAESQPA